MPKATTYLLEKKILSAKDLDISQIFTYLKK